VCITSANLSKGAWGQLVKNDSCLMIRNYEIGVLFTPVSLGHATFHRGPVTTIERYRIYFPLPSVLPPNAFTSSDEPWTWNTEHNVPDMCGNTWPLQYRE